jgi:hypothetical protein
MARNSTVTAGGAPAGLAGAVEQDDRREAKTPHLRLRRRPTDRSPHAATAVRAKHRLRGWYDPDSAFGLNKDRTAA